jgi:hypothetical protein
LQQYYDEYDRSSEVLAMLRTWKKQSGYQPKPVLFPMPERSIYSSTMYMTDEPAKPLHSSMVFEKTPSSQRPNMMYASMEVKRKPVSPPESRRRFNQSADSDYTDSKFHSPMYFRLK